MLFSLNSVYAFVNDKHVELMFDHVLSKFQTISLLN